MIEATRFDYSGCSLALPCFSYSYNQNVIDVFERVLQEGDLCSPAKRKPYLSCNAFKND